MATTPRVVTACAETVLSFESIVLVAILVLPKIWPSVMAQVIRRVYTVISTPLGQRAPPTENFQWL